MTKTVLPEYVFSAAAKTVTVSGLAALRLDRLALITNVTRNVVIYNFADPAKGATIAGNVITLAFNTTAHSDADRLRIDYDTAYGDDGPDRAVVGNIRTKFRDSFANRDISQPNPASWDLVSDTANHIVNQGGNAAGASYLRISLSPFDENSEVSLLSKKTFKLPMRVAFALSMSQRFVGQEVFMGLVGVDPVTKAVETITAVADKTITGATASITTNVGTFTLTNHGLNGGDRVCIVGCAERRLNVGPVYVTPIDKDTFSVPVTLANGTYSTVGGVVKTEDPLRYARNAVGLLPETTTVTNASLVARRSGAKFRQTNVGIATTVAAQTNASAFTDSFNAAAIQELVLTLEELSLRSWTADSAGGISGFSKFSGSVPNEDGEYKILLRARNLDGLTKPIARISSAVKAASSTATITTVAAHGLVVGDQVQVVGIRDQTNFASSSALTVATVPSTTTFTVAFGTTTTVTSSGGAVVIVQGSTLLAGVLTQSVQSFQRTSNVITLIGSAAWATPLPGEYVQVYGMEGAAAAYDGAYKVLRASGTTLDLESVGADVALVATTGGVVIRRTDVRLHTARLVDHTHVVTEVSGGRGNQTDVNNAVPVSITHGVVPAVGTALTTWSAAGPGGQLQADVVSGTITGSVTSATISPGIIGNVGTLAHSFQVAVTAASGTAPTLDVGVEESADNGANWIRIYDFPRITAVGSYVSPLIRAQWGTRYRYVQTVGGTTPSFTRTINRDLFNGPGQLFRQFVDRTIVPATLNSVTPTYNVDGCTNLMLVLDLGAATTPPTLTLEGSEDGLAWYQLGAGTLTGVASSVVVMNVAGVMPKFVRARVSSAGAAVTLNFVSIKALAVA